METQASQILQFIRPSGIFSAVLVLAVTWLLGRILTHLTDRLAASFGRQRLLIRQTASLLRFGLYVLGVLVGLRLIFDVSSEVLAVVGGTIVVTVGLVLKDQAASILAGVTILIEKPFRVGDRVSFGGYYGDIRSIGLRSVRLVTLDDNEVTIPNSKFLSDPVASGNSGEFTMLVQQDFLIGFDQDVEKAKRLVEEALTSSCYFSLSKPWTVLVNQVVVDATVAVRLRAKAYVIDLSYEKQFESDVAQRVLDVFRSEEIRMPFHMTNI